MNFHKNLNFAPDDGGGGGQIDSAAEPKIVQPSKMPTEPTGDVKISKEEYERLLALESKTLSMVSKEEFDKIQQESARAEAKLKVKAEGQSFKNSVEILKLTKEIEKFGLKVKIDDFQSLESLRVAFLEEAKSKFGLEFVIDKSGDLDTQVQNLSLMIQETNIFKQLQGTRAPQAGDVVNNTKAKQLEENLKKQGRI